MVTNTVVGMSLFAGMLILGVSIWAHRSEELEQGNLKGAYLNSLVFVLLFMNFAFQVTLHWQEMNETQRVVASLAAACFLATAILMVSLTYRMRKTQIAKKRADPVR